MNRTPSDKVRVANSILGGYYSAYTRESEVYQRALKGLCRLSHRELDALWAVYQTQKKRIGASSR
jgi:hypothetical protein